MRRGEFASHLEAGHHSVEGADSNILNIVQRSPKNPILGYKLSAGYLDTELGKGPDRKYGTSDDLVHTTLDDDLRVRQAVIDFLKSKR